MIRFAILAATLAVATEARGQEAQKVTVEWGPGVPCGTEVTFTETPSAPPPTIVKIVKKTVVREVVRARIAPAKKTLVDPTQDRRVDLVEQDVRVLAVRADNADHRADAADARATSTNQTIDSLRKMTVENDLMINDEVGLLARGVDARDHSYGLAGLGHDGTHLLIGGGFGGNIAGAAGGPSLIVGCGRPIGFELGGAYGYSGKVDGQTVYQTDVTGHLTLETHTALTFLLGVRYEHRNAPNSTNWWGGDGGMRYYLTKEVAIQGTIAMGRLFKDQGGSKVSPGGNLSAMIVF